MLDLLQQVQVLVLDEAAARRFGEVRAWQLDRGLGSPDLDLFNAAIALVHNLTLVTHNVQDYANIPGLQVVDWLNP
ncbi:MAG: type II toxin-antitoxin system VapC family toxin [Pirellulaceae bacterium]|nr:type II toxin-antitoxin system VapC family toxin [Pirellulaceae bacterium]